MVDVEKIRHDFPILQRSIYGKPLIYFDNTATSQTPRCVVEEIEKMYYRYKANVHRGVHCLSQEATDAMEAARLRVRDFINAGSREAPPKASIWWPRATASCSARATR